MKITPNGPGDADVAQIVQNDKKVGAARQEKESTAQRSGASASVNISPEARKLQHIAELARKGDDLRAAKVKALKAEIDSGRYQVSAEDVAKSILRSEISELLKK